VVSESQKYTAGRSGFGGADYASAAWRAGDLERSRLQQESEAARRQSAVAGGAAPSSGAYNSTYSGSSGGGFTFFSVVVFVVASVYGLGVGVPHFVPNIEQQILPYVGPDGLVSKNVFFWTIIAILTTIGILIRKILRWVLGLGLAAAIVGGVVSLLIR